MADKDKVVPLRRRIEAELPFVERLRHAPLERVRETLRLRVVALGYALSLEYRELLHFGVDVEAATRLVQAAVFQPEYTERFRVEVIPIEPPAGREGE